MNIHNAGRLPTPENKIWTCTKFTGHYPVGVSAVVSAPTAEKAAELLNKSLKFIGLPGDALPESMCDLSQFSEGFVVVLNDGNY